VFSPDVNASRIDPSVSPKEWVVTRVERFDEQLPTHHPVRIAELDFLDAPIRGTLTSTLSRLNSFPPEVSQREIGKHSSPITPPKPPAAAVWVY